MEIQIHLMTILFYFFHQINHLEKQKGSDASWKDNNEPPEDEIDYSDDEQEKLAKQKRRAKTRGKERNWNDREWEDTGPNKMERRDADHSQKRVFKRPSRNMFQSPTPVPLSSPRPYSPQSFGSPPSENFGSSGQRRNAVWPQPFGFTEWRTDHRTYQNTQDNQNLKYC